MNLPKPALAAVCVAVLAVVFAGAYAGASVINKQANAPIDTSVSTVIAPDCSEAGTGEGLTKCDMPSMEVRGAWEKEETYSEFINGITLKSERGSYNNPDVALNVLVIASSKEQFEQHVEFSMSLLDEQATKSAVTKGTATGYDISYTRASDTSPIKGRSLYLLKDGKMYSIDFMGQESKWALYEGIINDAIASLQIN